VQHNHLHPGELALTWLADPSISIAGDVATITFTHIRPEAGPLFKEGALNESAIVRARIVTPMANLVALRDLLNRVIQQPHTPVPPAGGPPRH
jgi:hypothetical protein